MNISRNVRFLPLLAGLVGILWAAPARSQLLIPEVTVDYSRLPEEAQKKLTSLDSILTKYLEAQDWAGDDYQYDFPVQINIFFSEYTADPQEDHFKASLIATNKQDVRFEDVHWQFGLRAPYDFRPGAFQPFKSVVEYYVWMLIGTEFDRLEKLGGTKYYEKARQIYLESSGSIYYDGWDKRIDLLRAQIDDARKTQRELNFFYYTGIYYDEKKDYQSAKDYLYYALVKLDKVPIDIQRRFLEVNNRQFAEALVRAGYPKGVTALIKLDPERRSLYETIAPDSLRLKAGKNN
jgi:hypothetical protein